MNARHHQNVDAAPGLANGVDRRWHFGLEMIHNMQKVSCGVEPMRFIANDSLIEEVGLAMVGGVYRPSGADGEVLLGEEVGEEGLVEFFGGADAVGYKEGDGTRFGFGFGFGGVLLYGEP